MANQELERTFGSAKKKYLTLLLFFCFSSINMILRNTSFDFLDYFTFFFVSCILRNGKPPFIVLTTLRLPLFSHEMTNSLIKKKIAIAQESGIQPSLLDACENKQQVLALLERHFDKILNPPPSSSTGGSFMRQPGVSDVEFALTQLTVNKPAQSPTTSPQMPSSNEERKKLQKQESERRVARQNMTSTLRKSPKVVAKDSNEVKRVLERIG